MKNKVVIIFVIAVIIILGVLWYSKINNKNNNDINNDVEDTSEYDKVESHPIDVQGEQNVKVNSDGSKENTSDKLKVEQNINGIKISNTKLTYTNGISKIEADIKNDTGKDIQELGIVKIKIKDETGKIVREMSTYVMTIKLGETKKINASITSEIVNATEIEYSI